MWLKEIVNNNIHCLYKRSNVCILSLINIIFIMTVQDETMRNTNKCGANKSVPFTDICNVVRVRRTYCDFKNAYIQES